MPMVLVIKSNRIFGFELMDVNTMTISAVKSIPNAVISIGIIIIDRRFKLP